MTDSETKIKELQAEIERLKNTLYEYCEVCKDFFIGGCEH
jgi:phage host-nuclease inhibitor protein Gam